MSKRTAGTSSQSHFSHVPSAEIKRSVFDRPTTNKLSFNCSDLVPFYIDEVLPGDSFSLETAFVARTTTPVFPVMDDLEIEFFYFFVPNRLVWEDWQALHGENKHTAWVPSSPPSLVPSWVIDQQVDSIVPVGSLGDYFGLPPDIGENPAYYSQKLITLPLRMYALIWNDWFRDQNLQSPIVVKTDSAPEYFNGSLAPVYSPIKPCFKVNKKHDYFTSCLPAPQKSTSVFLPISGLATVLPFNDEYDKSKYPSVQMLRWRDSNGNTPSADGRLGINSGFTGSDVGGFTPGSVVHPSNLYADLGSINLSTISELRQAFQIQKLFERDARGGTRYTEIVRSHFGVVSPDSRLQRPEYLGGFKQRLSMQQVNQTSSTTGARPLGSTAAYSLTASVGGHIRQSFTEHGFVIGLVTVRNKKTYSQGVERFWFKRDRFDYYYPALAHISEQPVYTREIFAGASNPGGVFGYQEAWAEYRYKPNRVSGYMRPDVNKNLSAWHYADKYDSRPILSDSWIRDNTRENVDRTLVVQSSESHQIIADILVKNRAARPMPVYSVPGLIDHF